jgi:DNA-binding MarR family transcriptional regulator
MSDRFVLDEFLPYRLNRASERVSLGFAAQYRKKYKMTRPEWRALAALGSYGRLTATQVGAHSTMHKTKVSRAVLALEKRGWLKRKENVADRRVEHLELTPLGVRYYDELADLARLYEQSLLDQLGPRGLDALRRGLAAVEKSMICTPRAGES